MTLTASISKCRRKLFGNFAFILKKKNLVHLRQFVRCTVFITVGHTVNKYLRVHLERYPPGMPQKRDIYINSFCISAVLASNY